jgi:hypothetical protein
MTDGKRRFSEQLEIVWTMSFNILEIPFDILD